MKLSSKKANKLLKKLNDDYQLMLSEENENCTFIASTTENIEDCRPKYNYEEIQKKLYDFEVKIRKLKHAINVFNTTTVIYDFGITIDEALVMLPQLTKKKEKLSILRKNKERCRVKNRYGDYIGERIDYIYINYNLDDIKKDYDDVVDELDKLQISIDKANTSGSIEVNI